jgi:hypothetical protein
LHELHVMINMNDIVHIEYLKYSNQWNFFFNDTWMFIFNTQKYHRFMQIYVMIIAWT